MAGPKVRDPRKGRPSGPPRCGIVSLIVSGGVKNTHRWFSKQGALIQINARDFWFVILGVAMPLVERKSPPASAACAAQSRQRDGFNLELKWRGYRFARVAPGLG